VSGLSTWFSTTLETCLRERSIKWAHLLGGLAVEGNTIGPAHSNPGLFADAGSAAPGWIASAEIQAAILSAVEGAQRQLQMQCHELPLGEAARPLLEAVLGAAQRGVECRLLWRDGLAYAPAEAGAFPPLHERIHHRTGAVDEEFLVVDKTRVLVSSLAPVKWPSGEPATSVLLTRHARDAGACRNACRAFDAAWQAGAPAFCPGKAESAIVAATPATEEGRQ
jgi:hypothetical protein